MAIPEKTKNVDTFRPGDHVSWTARNQAQEREAITGFVTEDVDSRCGDWGVAVKRDTYVDATKSDPKKYECVVKGDLRSN